MDGPFTGNVLFQSSCSQTNTYCKIKLLTANTPNGYVYISSWCRKSLVFKKSSCFQITQQDIPPVSQPALCGWTTRSKPMDGVGYHIRHVGKLASNPAMTARQTTRHRLAAIATTTMSNDGNIIGEDLSSFIQSHPDSPPPLPGQGKPNERIANIWCGWVIVASS